MKREEENQSNLIIGLQYISLPSQLRLWRLLWPKEYPYVSESVQAPEAGCHNQYFHLPAWLYLVRGGWSTARVWNGRGRMCGRNLRGYGATTTLSTCLKYTHILRHKSPWEHEPGFQNCEGLRRTWPSLLDKCLENNAHSLHEELTSQRHHKSKYLSITLDWTLTVWK